jgi:hypothetical protein
MPWPDGVKVPTVEGGDLADPEPLGDGDDSRVGGPEWEVGVGLDQLGHPLVVGQLEVQTSEQIRTSSVVLVAISGRNQQAVSQTITQERPNPSVRRSSWLLPRSDRPLANEPNQDGGHSPADTDPLCRRASASTP